MQRPVAPAGGAAWAKVTGAVKRIVARAKIENDDCKGFMRVPFAKWIGIWGLYFVYVTTPDATPRPVVCHELVNLRGDR